MEPSAADFHIEEYKQLREEVTTMITKTEQLLQYCVVIAAAVFAWLATQAVGLGANEMLCTKLPINDPLAETVWWIPTVAVLVVGLLGGGRFVRVKEMGRYLLKLENALGIQSLGWEKFLADRFPTVSIVTIAAWAVLLFGTGWVANKMQERIPGLKACPMAKP